MGKGTSIAVKGDRVAEVAVPVGLIVKGKGSEQIRNRIKVTGILFTPSFVPSCVISLTTNRVVGHSITTISKSWRKEFVKC